MAVLVTNTEYDSYWWVDVTGISNNTVNFNVCVHAGHNFYSNAARINYLKAYYPNGTSETVVSSTTTGNINTGDHVIASGTFLSGGYGDCTLELSAWLYSNHNYYGSGSFNIPVPTGSLDVNPVINGTVYDGGLDGFTFDLSGPVGASNVTDYWNSSAPIGSYTATPRNKTGYTTSAASGTLTAGGKLDLRPKWNINSYSFNLNILNPDGSEPYSTGEAGSVEFSSNGGSSYSRVYNEPTNSYNYGTSFKLRNFTPGTGRYLASVSGISPNNTTGPWSATQGTSGLTINFQTGWNTYTHTISHWATGFQHGEGNNGAQNAYKLQDTSFTNKYNSTFVMNTSRGVTAPNGFTLRNSFGTPYISGSWGSYNMGTTVTQKASNGGFEYYYDPITYTITYKMNGGTNPSSNPSTYNVLYGVTFVNPTRNGYNFTGWTINGSSVTGINPGANATFSSATNLRNSCASRTTGNQTVMANWLEIPPSQVQIDGNASSPFTINLNWSASGLHISDYTVYYKASNESTYHSQSFGTSTSGSLTVNEETTYDIYVKATNPGGSTDSSVIHITTPADQARIYIKKEGSWLKGKTYLKKDGQWVKAKKIYIKKEGQWVLGVNEID